MSWFMGWFMGYLKTDMLLMLEPPWRPAPEGKRTDWFEWLSSWSWAIAGLVLGAFIAPPLVRYLGFANSRLQDQIDIGIAVLMGVLVQLVGWSLLLAGLIWVRRLNRLPTVLKPVLYFALSILVQFAPLVGVGYGIYRYLVWVGAGQRSVTIAFIGGLLVKAFVIPAVWGAIKSRAFQAFMRWLRGDKVKAKGA